MVKKHVAVDWVDEVEGDKAFVAKVEVSKGRWSTRYWLIWQEPNDDLKSVTLWGALYDEPATEMQEGQDRWPTLDPGGETVEAVEFEATAVVRTEYRPKET